MSFKEDLEQICGKVDGSFVASVMGFDGIPIEFFFLMIRRPPRSTLFPTRRSSDLRSSHAARLRCDPRRRHPRSAPPRSRRDRKSTRLNSSHSQISYAVFCLKKKKTTRLQYEYNCSVVFNVMDTVIYDRVISRHTVY